MKPFWQMPTFKATIELEGYYPRIQEWEMHEGEYSDLVSNNGYHNHHPVAMLHSLVNDKRFKHLSSERLYYLIDTYGKTRSAPHWGNSSYTFGNNILACIELEPGETEERVAIHGGVCCSFCDGMAWVPDNTKEYNYENRDLFLKRLCAQREYASLMAAGEMICRTPVLCDDCLAVARSNKISNAHWRYDATNALRGLLTLITSRYKTKKGKRHDTRNISPPNARRANRKLRNNRALP